MNTINKNDIAIPAEINVPDTFNFKDKRLMQAAQVIANAGADMKRNAATIATELGKVKAEKSYEADGFKSVAEFASKTFGIERSNAYQLATVGERFYNAEIPETIKDTVSKISPSNLAKITALSNEEIEQAVKSGDITPDKSQKQLGEYAAKVKDSKKSKKATLVRDNLYKVVATLGNQTFNPENLIKESAVQSTVLEHFFPGIPAENVEVIKLKPMKAAEQGAPDVKRAVYVVSANELFQSIVVAYKLNRVKTEKGKGKNGPAITYTREQLLEMLAAMEEAEG